MYQMAIINSGFLVDNPMDLTEPLEKLIKVGFGLDRDAQVEEIDVELDDEEAEDDEDDNDIFDEIDLSTLDEQVTEEPEVMEEL